MELTLILGVIPNRYKKYKKGDKFRFMIKCQGILGLLTYKFYYKRHKQTNMTDFKICLLKHLIREKE